MTAQVPKKIEKILVTGMSGFIATNFFQFLAREHPDVDIWGFDLAYGQDLRNSDQVMEAVDGKDWVIHFGALTHIDSSIKNPRPFLDTNVIGTFNVLEACTKHKVSMIHISSSEVYGTNQNPHNLPMLESHPLCGHSPYAWSKIAAERACYSWWQTYETDVRILRLFNQYGPYQDVRKVLPKFMRQLELGLPLTIYGDGKSTRDWVFVQDTVKAIWKARELPACEVVNIATGRSYSILEVIDELKALMQKAAKVVYVKHTDERWGHVKNLCGDYSKAEHLIGWKPETPLLGGLDTLYDWIKANGWMAYKGGEFRALT